MRITEDRQTSTFFNASVHFILGNGETFLFWYDPWLMGSSISEIAPEVVNMVPARRQKQRTVTSALMSMSWIAYHWGAHCARLGAIC
jgi:hypothetical protein